MNLLTGGAHAASRVDTDGRAAAVEFARNLDLQSATDAFGHATGLPAHTAREVAVEYRRLVILSVLDPAALLTVGTVLAHFADHVARANWHTYSLAIDHHGDRAGGADATRSLYRHVFGEDPPRAWTGTAGDLLLSSCPQ
jgi:hypothetical protein